MKKKKVGPQGRRYTKGEKRHIVAARRKGLTLVALRKKFGVSGPSVIAWSRK